MSFLPGSAPLVGRSDELATLAGLAGVEDPPRPGLVLLSGDAGIGKSRLLEALAERAGRAGWRVAVGHCLDLAGSPLPYLPFTELAERLRAARPERMAQLAARWPDVRPLLGRPAGAEAPPDPPDRGAFFAAVHAALTELGREGPLLLVVEDLHWADQSSYDLLSFLLARRFEVPVSVVASYRRDDLHRRHPLRPIVAAWSRLPGMGRLVLEPLPDPAVRRLVEVLEPGSLDPGQVEEIVDRAEGNAFFTEELVAAAGSTTSPRDLADLLLLRLERLGADARSVVQSASAGGRLVPDRLLTAVVGLDPAQTAAALREAVEFHVLVAEEQGYRFRHSMLAEAVYADLLPGERRRVHAAYVAVLVDDPGAGTAADLARHALAAGDDLTAYRASRQAGDDAAAVGGPDEAARHYQRALDLVADEPLATAVPVGEVVLLTEQAATAAAAAGLLRRAEAIVAAQLRRLPADAAPEDRARLLVALAEVSVLTDSPTDERAVVREALDLIPPEPPTTLRARAVALHALILAGHRYDEEAVRWAEEGLMMPPELRVGEVTVQLHTVLARVAERGGDASHSQQVLWDFAAEARGRDDPAEVRALHQLAGLQLEQGELDRAFDTYRSAAERSAELGRPFAPYGVDAKVSAAAVAYQRGRWDVVLELTEVGPDAPALAAAGLLSVRLAVLAGQGNVASLALMDGIRPQWTTDGVIAVHSGAAAIDLHGQAGDLDAARAVHDAVVSCLRQLWGADDSQARIRLAAVLLGQLAEHLPALEPEQAAVHLAHGLEQAERAGGATGMGRRAEPGLESQAWLVRLAAEVLRLRRAAGEAVDPDELVAAWRTSVDAFARYGHVYEQARSTARLAAVLRANGAGAEAARLAATALETASALGARPLVAELTRLVPGLASTPVDLLTPREREVLTLVADGLSNRQVGERLFVSTKTASVHVSNILAKLGARSRTEAASLARRRGLLG